MRKTNYFQAVFFLVMLILGIPLYGQNQHDTLKYTMDVDFSGRRISGTFNQVIVGGGINMSLRYGNWHLENKTTYRYNETNKRLLEDNWYDLVTLKYYLKGKKKLYPGLFYHFDNTLMFSVKSRHQYGMGLGSEFNMGAVKLSILTGIASENATFGSSQFVNSERDVFNRKNGLFLFKLNNGYDFAKKKISFSYQFFFFQSLKERADYDIWLSPRISFKVLKGLSVFVVYDYRFENVHLETLSSYNDIVLFGLKLKLRN